MMNMVDYKVNVLPSSSIKSDKSDMSDANTDTNHLEIYNSETILLFLRNR